MSGLIKKLFSGKSMILKENDLKIMEGLRTALKGLDYKIEFTKYEIIIKVNRGD